MNKTYLFLFVILFACPNFLFGQQAWILRSADDNGSIPYAKITELNSQQWVSSDPNGEFRLDLSLFPNTAKFNISAMGYADTLISLDLLKKSKAILMEPRFVEMQEYLVASTKLKKHVIGDFDLPLSLATHTTQKRNASTTHRYAVYFEFPDKNTRILSRISLYLSELGDPDPKMTVRVLVSDEIRKPKEGNIYKSSSFRDIRGKANSLYEGKGFGWTQLDLSGDEFIIPGKYKGVFVVFDVVNHGEEPYKSLVIPFQNQSNEKIHAAFYNTGGSIGTLNKRNDHFAVVLEYLTE